jgi:molybdopterin-guanine dinucleotide biosynthesis protein A
VLLERKSVPSIEAYMERANRKALGWVESLKPAVVDFSDDAESFTNVNTRSDLQRLERWFRLRGLGV